jgi:hypothetical protein
MFLGDNLLAWLLLALGGALFAGNVMAIVRPPAERRDDTQLQRAPLTRSLLYAAIGLIAAVWAVASLASG